MAKRPKVFGHLLVEVIKPERCVACGSCVSICPVDAISFVDGLPKLTGKCTACGECYTACPRVEYDFGESEAYVLGRKRSVDEEAHGILLEAYAVRTLQPKVKEHAQDGGAVTSILLSCLSEGDRAVVAGLNKEKIWSPVPVLTRDMDIVIECAGTKYTSAPMLLAVKQAEKEGVKKLAFVSTPCQIQALRRRQKNAPKTDTLALGLFCMETFNHDKLMAYLKDQGVEPEKVKKFEIKSGKFIAHREGEPAFEVKIRKLKELSRNCCRVCLDYTSELADLSIGNVGSPDGYSTVLVRTKKGEAALKAAEKKGLIEVKSLKDYQPGMSLVDRLSDMKKKDNSGKSLDQ
jgi:coenzyme F420-reducing hydrogenase beta subunit